MQQPSVIFYDPHQHHVDSCPQGPFFVFNMDDLLLKMKSLDPDLRLTVCVCSTDIQTVLENIHDLDQLVSVYICKKHRNRVDQNSSTNYRKVKEIKFANPLKWLVDIHLELSVAAGYRRLVEQEKMERQNAIQCIQRSAFNPRQSVEEKSTSEDEVE
jgi:hypothetical protein